jgi:glycosyltransferase involved in cell wall biosynthesis
MTTLAVSLSGTDRGDSGIGRWVREMLPRLARAFREAGGDVVALGTARDLAAYAPADQGARAARLPDACDRPAVSAAFHLVGAGAAARRAGADVLLLPAANRRLSLRSPLPTVAVVHDLAQLHVPGKYDAARMLYVRRVVVGSLRRATRLVAVSESTRDDLARVLGAQREVAVISNGVDTDRFTPPLPGDVRVVIARSACDLERPYVLYLSRLEHPGKNHLRLLRAFAAGGLGRTHDLVFAGKDWGARRLIEEEAARLGAGPWLRLLGFVSDDLVPGLVAGAAAVAMVGLHEGFGLPALEALATGCPVVTSTTGALPEVVGDLGAACDPLDEAAVGAALRRALGDAELRRRVAQHGPARARSHDWNASAARLAALCLEVAA